MKERWLRGAAAPMRTPGLRTLARAFFLSLAVHAALVAVLWYLISTALPTPPREQRVEVELTPHAHSGIATPAVAPAPAEPVPNGSERQRDEARADRVLHAPARTAQTTPPLVAAKTKTNLPTLDGDAPSPREAESPRPVQTQVTPALDLQVLDWLARYRTYPLAARRARLEGVVQLRVTLMPDGRFVDVRVERSSGHALLDQAALDLLARASPLPAEFASARNGQIELQLPIVYRMRASSS